MDVKKMMIAAACLAVMLIAVLLVQSCQINLPRWGPGPRACIAERDMWVRCSDNNLGVEQCAGNVSTWIPKKNCSSEQPVCDYSIGTKAVNRTNIPCIVGCIYQGIGYKVGEYGCVNETTYAECASSGEVEFFECQTNGCVCYGGYKGSCISQQEFEGITRIIQVSSGQDLDTALGGGSLGSGDLPYLLADGTYVDEVGQNNNSVGTSQSLKFTPGTAQLQADNSLTGFAYTYTLTMGSSILMNASDGKSDVINTTLMMMGKKLTITDTDAELNYLTLSDGTSTYKLTNNGGVALVASDGTENEIPSSTVQFLGVVEGEVRKADGIVITYTPVSLESYALRDKNIDPIFGNFEVKLESVPTEAEPYANVSVGKDVGAIQPVNCMPQELAAEQAQAPSGGGGGGGAPTVRHGSSGGGGSFIMTASQRAAAESNVSLAQAAPLEQASAEEQGAAPEEGAKIAEGEQAIPTLQKKTNPLLIIGPIAAIAIVIGIVLVVRRKKKAV